MQKSSKKTTAIVVAAGSGTRMGADIKKQFMMLSDAPVIIHTLRKFEACDLVDSIVVVTATEDIIYVRDLVEQFGVSKVTDIVAGGSTRARSVKNGLKNVTADFVAIHDGARPCVSVCDIERTIEAAVKYGASLLGEKVADTIKKVGADGTIQCTVDRAPLWKAQTPQCFETKLIAAAYENADCDVVTDDAQVAELSGIKVYAVEATGINIKITKPADLIIAQNGIL